MRPSAVFGRLVAPVLLAASCATPGPISRGGDATFSSLPNTELLRLGVDEFSAGRLDRARGYFRHILKYDPRDARAHMALAATFDVAADGGDRTQREVAEVGYEQALQFDPRNWLAAYRLGVLELEDERVGEATQHLARAAILNRQEPAILGDLARALYLNGELPHAQAVAEKALEMAPDDPSLLKYATIIAAAQGDSAQSRQWQARFERVAGSADASAALARRVEDWRLDRARLGRQVASAGDGRIPPDTTIGMPGATRSPFLTPGPIEQRTTMLTALPAPPAGAKARMVQVDAILIRTQEVETNSRGVNLLHSLQLQFGGERSRTVERRGDEGDALAGTVTQTLRRQLTLPAVTYSLEIANTGYDRSDVLARPTLIALDGQPANFFVGEELSIPVTAQFNSNLIDKTVGIEMAVTPTFLDDDTVLLNISASRSFLNTFFVPQANSALRTTQQRVTTAVVTDFGKTVVLSGLTEHESKSTTDGVPVLQELPGIQYFFSNKNKLLFESSVMIALTPRRVGQTEPGRTPGKGTVEMDGVTQVEDFFPDLGKRARALAVLSKSLQQNSFRALVSMDDMSAVDPFKHRTVATRLARQLRSILVF